MSWLTRALVGASMITAAGGAGHAAELRPSIQLNGRSVPSFSDQKWFVHVGPAGLFLSEGAKFKLGGQKADGNVHLTDRASAAIEIGYHITPEIAIAVSGGTPPKFGISGKGAASAFGKVGAVLGGPLGIFVQYHFDFGSFRPYVGAGPTALIIFKSYNGTYVRDFKVDSAFGFAAQAGFDFMLNENWGVFFDVKKVYLRTRARGNVYDLFGDDPVPARARVKLDPLVTTAGITYRF